MTSNNIMFGADPEVAAVHKTGDKNYIIPPAYFRKYLEVPTVENGSHPIFVKGKEFYAHEDGAAFEVAVEPSTDWEEVFDRIQEAYKLLEDVVISQFPHICDPKLAILPTVDWEASRWLGEDDEFHWATRFGCDPDEDAFESQYDSPTEDAKIHPYRYCGGHIHFSKVDEFVDDPIRSIQCLAMTTGLAAVAFSDVPELELARTYRYGRPGKFRVQNYSDGSQGIEYRTPSTRWTSDKSFAKKVFEWSKIGITNLIQTSLGDDIVNKFSFEGTKAIINADQKAASDILSAISGKI